MSKLNKILIAVVAFFTLFLCLFIGAVIYLYRNDFANGNGVQHSGDCSPTYPGETFSPDNNYPDYVVPDFDAPYSRDDSHVTRNDYSR